MKFADILPFDRYFARNPLEHQSGDIYRYPRSKEQKTYQKTGQGKKQTTLNHSRVGGLP
jgi:hypothetical protein